MNRKNISIFLCILFLCSMTGCQPVPENVEQDIADMETEKAGNEEIDIAGEYKSLEEIAELNGMRCEEERNLLHVDAEIEVPEVAEAYHLELKGTSSFWEERYQILKDVSGMELTEEDPYSYNNDAWENGDVYQKYEGNIENAETEVISVTLGDCTEEFVVIDNRGLLKIINMEVPFSWETAEEPVIEERYIGRELAELSKEYTLLDGTIVNMDTARAMFDEQAECFEQYLPNQDIELRELRVMGIGDGTCQLDMYGGVSYKGMQLSRLPAYLTVDWDFVHSFNLGTCMYQYALTSADGAWISDLMYAYEVVSETATYEELLSLDSALDILATKVAANKVTNISEISLEYLISYPKDRDELVDKDIVYEGRPAWRFTEEMEQSSHYASMSGDCKVGNVFYIDAVSGEFYGYEDMLY